MNLARNTWRRCTRGVFQEFELRRGVGPGVDLSVKEGATVSELRELLAELEDKGFGEMVLVDHCAREDTYFPIEALYLNGEDNSVCLNWSINQSNTPDQNYQPWIEYDPTKHIEA